MSRTAGPVSQSNESLTEVRAASENANRAAGDVLGGVVSVERAAEAMDAALAQFLRRVQTISVRSDRPLWAVLAGRWRFF